ncbi:hypothetical protein GALMADRAFT_239912 [Galerina marginata CBS 339.88]|uniref:Uncharacterized protein n=1 Tax=Galerina marginata (strain CBS 339.88) TaxID=685588 RepID=A0A067TES5_GALM3|nr:hypothetical protein GALMADRAFT_239912 [Galerina marginata CBS 339.88]
MTPFVGFDPAWEQIRFKHVQLYYNAQHTYRRTLIFQPGHIAFCRGSIEVAFYSHLVDTGVKLRPREMPVDSEKPKRYCIVNKHIADQKYEVFLLTTFGGAKSLDQLGLIARYFGMPMGSTQWIDDTPGLTTIPPILGWNKASFVFALPTIQIIERSNLPALTRLPPLQLERLRQFADMKRKALPHIQGEIRKSLWNQHLYRQYAPAPYTDEFKPLPMEKVNPITLDEDDTVIEVFYGRSSAISPSKPKRIKVPPARNDIKWPLHYLNQDLNGSQSVVHRHHPAPWLGSFPKPHYASCLPISIRKFRHFIR